MTFDKAKYWADKEAKKKGKVLPSELKIAGRIVCSRCSGTRGLFLNDHFFCFHKCDQNSRWDRFMGWLGLGNWRVIYPDGRRSEPMGRRTAEGYRFLFGGDLIRTKAAIRNPSLKGRYL